MGVALLVGSTPAGRSGFESQLLYEFYFNRSTTKHCQVAQWRSSALLMRWLWVRPPPWQPHPGSPTLAAPHDGSTLSKSEHRADLIPTLTTYHSPTAAA